MADDGDLAAYLQQQANELAEARQRERPRFESRETCLDCGIIISDQRRALGSVLRCVDCETDNERYRR